MGAQMRMMPTPAAPQQKAPRKPRTKLPPVPPESLRRSSRVRDLKPEYTKETIDQFGEMVDEEDDARRVTHLGHVYHVPDITPEEGQKVAEIERILQTGPTVVCSKYTAVIRYLQRRFGAPAITGKTTHANRDKALAAFEKDGVLLITEKSAGVGLCLQRAHNMVFVEPSIENKEQVLGRVKRLGQTQTVHVWTLVCTGTLDDQSAHPLFATV